MTPPQTPVPPQSALVPQSEVIPHKAILLYQQPSTGLAFDHQEGLYFQLFQTHTASELSGFFDNVFWSQTVLQECRSEPIIKHAVVALGCAGWGAGQLEQELTEDSWLTVPVDAQLLFETPIDARWRAAAGTIGIDISQLADHSGHA